MAAVITSEGKTFTRIVQDAESTLSMSRRTTAVYLKRLSDKGLISSGGGLYWAGNQ
jgi:predicted transcriptional regulator